MYVRYLPSLMDRLTDHEPGKRLEAPRPQAMSFQEYRAGFQRDLMRLMSYGLQPSIGEYGGHPEVQSSVLNYGMPNLLGLADMGAKPALVEQNIVEAIKRFEPRVNRDSLRVAVSRHEDPSDSTMKNLEIEIHAELWAKPYSEHVYLLTSIDLHNASVKVKEWRNG
ncbi:MAG: type VI secretion system baseplate subunit TssE [Candidatus Hydrogenedentes bacterium]|nr:type VI secretion system baseplate subunit TssE [Candidatus Hydrogenedentota bacterium]